MRMIDTKRLVLKSNTLISTRSSRYEKPPEVCSDGYSAFCPLRGEPEGTCMNSVANAGSLSNESSYSAPRGLNLMTASARLAAVLRPRL
jgi:hypothetical protein